MIMRDTYSMKGNVRLWQIVYLGSREGSRIATLVLNGIRLSLKHTHKLNLVPSGLRTFVERGLLSYFITPVDNG